MIIVIVLGIKNFKSSNNNLITWGQSVKIGVGISIISALIGIIYNLIFINFIQISKKKGCKPQSLIARY